MSLTVQNIYDILKNDFEVAMAKKDASATADKATQEKMHNNFLIAKHRWQCLFQVHGCMIANINWEATFKEFTEKKQYDSIDQCICKAKSYFRFN